MRMYIYIYVCMYVYMYICIHIYMCMYICIYVYIYMNTCLSACVDNLDWRSIGLGVLDEVKNFAGRTFELQLLFLIG